MLKTLEADGLFHSYDNSNKERVKIGKARPFHCACCDKDIIHHSEHTTGYGDIDGRWHCFDCCGDCDRLCMETGTKYTLYMIEPSLDQTRRSFRVTNWPGTLDFPARFGHVWRHCGKCRAVKVYFEDHKGRTWEAVRYGDNTQICRCRLVQR